MGILRKVLMCLVIIVPARVSLAQEVHGDWVVTVIDADTVAALTENESGGAFGKVCWISSQQCIWAMTTATTCKNGDTYASLVNSESGARTVNLACSGEIKEGQLLAFQDYAAMNKISANDPYIGIALAMANGQFRVVRFSLHGSHDATQSAERLAKEARQGVTRDQSL